MKKYYRRLCLVIIILLTASAGLFVFFLTKKEAERVRLLRENTLRGMANDECSMFYEYVEKRMRSEQNSQEELTWPWDEQRCRTIATEAMWYTFANMGSNLHIMGSGSADMWSIYRLLECGFAGDLVWNGRRLNVPKSYIMLYETGLSDPLFALIPESFFEAEYYSCGSRDLTPEQIFWYAPSCHITGKRYENTVYVDNIEFYLSGDNGWASAFWTYEAVYSDVEVPKEARPYEFSMFENPAAYAEYYDLNFINHRSVWSLDTDDKEEIKRFEDAERKLNRKVEEEGAGLSADSYDDSLSELNIWGYEYNWEDYFNSSSTAFPSLFFVYTGYPLREAMHTFHRVYIYIALFLVLAILIVIFLIQSLRKSQERSAQSQREMTQSLARELENKERYERSRVAMTRAVAHELKTPLAVTKSYVENWEDFDEEQKKENLQKMVSQIDYVNDLVQDMLELSRMEAGAKQLNNEAVNLAELNALVLRQMESLAATKKITVNVPADRESLTVQADLSQMRTVLMNLVSNAIRYSAENILINISRDGEWVRYSITNDGEAIPKEKLDLIWEEFYRTDDARSDRMGGSGLGLAITKQILELHGAKYGCTSGQDGTTFYFSL